MTYTSFCLFKGNNKLTTSPSNDTPAANKSILLSAALFNGSVKTADLILNELNSLASAVKPMAPPAVRNIPKAVNPFRICLGDTQENKNWCTGATNEKLKLNPSITKAEKNQIP
jgi:hypothetical protein